MPEVTIAITELSLSILPEDHIDFDLFAVRIHRRPGDRWVVRLRRTFLLDRDGGWQLGLNLTADAIDAFTYGYDEAIALGHEALPLIEVNGKRALDVLRGDGDTTGASDAG